MDSIPQNEWQKHQSQKVISSGGPHKQGLHDNVRGAQNQQNAKGLWELFENVARQEAKGWNLKTIIWGVKVGFNPNSIDRFLGRKLLSRDEFLAQRVEWASI